MVATEHSLLLQKIASHAVCIPQKTAVITAEGERIPYSTLWENILRGAAWLDEMGVHEGDRIMLSALKEIEFVYVYFGAHLRGVTNVVVDASNNSDHLEYIASVVSPVLTVGLNLEDIRSVQYADMQLPDETSVQIDTSLSADSVADIMFTSGTTGRPKGVCLTHANIVASAMNINGFIGNGAEDVEFLGLPICHSFGLGRLRCNMLTGGTVVLHNGFANLKAVFSAFERYGVTGFGIVPAVWAYIKRFSGERIGKYAAQIKYIEIGSAAMPLEDKEILLRLFPDTRICMHYGLTEASRAVFMEFHENAGNLSTAGKSVSDSVSIRVLSDIGDPVPSLEEGEICVKGPMVTSSYFNPSDNEGAFFGDYFRTGDWGYMDTNGNLFLKARKKEIINVGGKKVSPIEIEDALEKVGIGESMVVAVKDPVLGEVPKALLVEGTFTMDTSEIREKLLPYLEIYKLPREYEVVKSIPKTASGKKKRTS